MLEKFSWAVKRIFPRLFTKENAVGGLLRNLADLWPIYAHKYFTHEIGGVGMEPAGAGRHRRSPKGELTGVSESIEPGRGMKKLVDQQTRMILRGGGGNRTRE